MGMVMDIVNGFDIVHAQVTKEAQQQYLRTFVLQRHRPCIDILDFRGNFQQRESRLPLGEFGVQTEGNLSSLRQICSRYLERVGHCPLSPSQVDAIRLGRWGASCTETGPQRFE